MANPLRNDPNTPLAQQSAQRHHQVPLAQQSAIGHHFRHHPQCRIPPHLQPSAWSCPCQETLGHRQVTQQTRGFTSVIVTPQDPTALPVAPRKDDPPASRAHLPTAPRKDDLPTSRAHLPTAPRKDDQAHHHRSPPPTSGHHRR